MLSNYGQMKGQGAERGHSAGGESPATTFVRQFRSGRSDCPESREREPQARNAPGFQFSSRGHKLSVKARGGCPSSPLVSGHIHSHDCNAQYRYRCQAADIAPVVFHLSEPFREWVAYDRNPTTEGRARVPNSQGDCPDVR